MRPLLIFLLLVNAVFFYWQTQWLETSETSAMLEPQIFHPGVERLKLLHELDPMEQESTDSGVMVLEPVESVVGSEESVITAQGDDEPMPEEDVRQMASADQAEVTEEEPSTREPAKVDTEDKTESLAEVPVVVPPMCFVLGPFAEATRAQAAQQILSSAGAQVEQAQEIQRSLQGYWVYLPSAKDFAGARETATVLQEKGIKDLFIMGSGAYQHAISLGLFRLQDAAQSRYKQIKELGFEPVLAEQHREKTLYRLLLSIAGDQPEIADRIRQLSGEYAGSQLESKPCEELHKPG